MQINGAGTKLLSISTAGSPAGLQGAVAPADILVPGELLGKSPSPEKVTAQPAQCHLQQAPHVGLHHSLGVARTWKPSDDNFCVSAEHITISCLNFCPTSALSLPEVSLCPKRRARDKK